MSSQNGVPGPFPAPGASRLDCDRGRSVDFVPFRLFPDKKNRHTMTGLRGTSPRTRHGTSAPIATSA
jgi:hypothetical protein